MLRYEMPSSLTTLVIKRKRKSVVPAKWCIPIATVLACATVEKHRRAMKRIAIFCEECIVALFLMLPPMHKAARSVHNANLGMPEEQAQAVDKQSDGNKNQNSSQIVTLELDWTSWMNPFF